MPNLTMEQLVAMGGMPPQGMVRLPSEDEKRELLKVQGMQVRTQAASMASAMLQHRQTTPTVWLKWAKHIEAYITEGADGGDTPSPVLSRP